MRVLILSQYYAPEPIPKPVELAEELIRRGHEVSVVTGFPNYPSGRLYDGYRLGLLQEERVGSVQVRRTYEYPYHGTRAIGRILNYLTFMCSAPLATFGRGGWDVIYVWHPPLTVGVAAWIIGRLRRVPFVYDVQDIWPESAVLTGVLRDGWIVRVLGRLEKFVYRHASHIFVVTDGARANLVAKGVPADKLSVMPHWLDDEGFSDEAADARQRVRVERNWTGRFVAMFAGNLGLAQGLDTLLDAVACVDRNLPLLLCFVGDGSDRARIQSLVAQRGLGDRVEFIARQPQSHMPPLLAAADLLVVHLKRSPISAFVVPTKTLAYLASGTPLLMAMEGAAADLVQQSGGGVVIPPEDAAAMAAALEHAMTQCEETRRETGRRGRAYVTEHLTARTVIPRYEAVLAQVAAAHARR